MTLFVSVDFTAILFTLDVTLRGINILLHVMTVFTSPFPILLPVSSVAINIQLLPVISVDVETATLEESLCTVHTVVPP